MEALHALVLRVLKDPKRKYLRQALGLPKAATPQRYQQNLEARLMGLFVYGDESEEFFLLGADWLATHQSEEEASEGTEQT